MEKSLKILILEDSETDAEIIQRLVKKAFAHADFKLSANKAQYIEALKEFEPEVILADNSLPQFDAEEALEIVRKQSLITPFILITGTVSEEFAVDIIKQGADDYILKDRLARLPAAIETAVKKRLAEKEKQAAVQKIIEAEEKYRTLIQRISDGFIALDTNWCCVYANKKIEEMTGRALASLLGKNIWDEFPEAYNSATYEAFHRAMETQEYVNNIDYFEPLDLWQENSIYPSPEGLLVFVRDITKQKKAEIAIRQSEEIRRLVMNAALDAIVCIDLNGYITVWNAQAEKMFGWAEEEVRGKDVSEIIIPVQYRESHKKGMQHYYKTGDGPVLNKLLELTALERSGKEFPVELSIVPVQQRNNKFFCAFIRDITLRKKAEQELRKSYEDIRELASHLQDVREEERTSMAREIHDELGQQLTGFKMDIFWLNRKLDSADKEVNDKIKSTLELIDAAIKTVRRISTDLRPSILDDLGFITAMEWQSDEFEKRSGVKVSFEKNITEIALSPKTSIALFRIYQELLTNVARHANATEVQASVYMNNEQLCLKVTDNGVGFDVKNISSKKTLGLLGMRERTLLLQGTYDIQSTPGKGTTIVIAVPLESV